MRRSPEGVHATHATVATAETANVAVLVPAVATARKERLVATARLPAHRVGLGQSAIDRPAQSVRATTDRPAQNVAHVPSGVRHQSASRPAKRIAMLFSIRFRSNTDLLPSSSSAEESRRSVRRSSTRTPS